MQNPWDGGVVRMSLMQLEALSPLQLRHDGGNVARKASSHRDLVLL